jgi:hypothetical protein
MKVKALTMFNDLKSNTIRKVGEIFDVIPKRAEELNSGPHGVLIEVIDKENQEQLGGKPTTKGGGDNVRQNKGSTQNKKHNSVRQ